EEMAGETVFRLFLVEDDFLDFGPATAAELLRQVDAGIAVVGLDRLPSAPERTVLVHAQALAGFAAELRDVRREEFARLLAIRGDVRGFLRARRLCIARPLQVPDQAFAPEQAAAQLH